MNKMTHKEVMEELDSFTPEELVKELTDAGTELETVHNKEND